jgi:hypothetical protein
MPSKKITFQEECSVRELYLGGLTGLEISLRIGVSVKQVYDSLRRQKIPRKSIVEQNRLRFRKSPLSFSFKEKFI